MPVLDQFITIVESFVPYSDIELKVSHDASKYDRSRVYTIALELSHTQLIKNNYLQCSDNVAGYDSVTAPWVAHMTEVNKFFKLKIHPALETKLNYIEVLIEKLQQEGLISQAKAKELLDMIKIMAIFPRKNIHLKLVKQDEKSQELHPIDGSNPIFTKAIADFQKSISTSKASIDDLKEEPYGRISLQFFDLLTSAFQNNLEKYNFYVKSALKENTKDSFGYILRCVAIFEFGAANLEKALEFAKLAAKFYNKHGALAFSCLANHLLDNKMSLKDLAKAKLLNDMACKLSRPVKSDDVQAYVGRKIEDKLKQLPTQLIYEFNQHKKALAMIAPQNARRYLERNKETKNQAMLYHQACLHSIMERLGLGGIQNKIKEHTKAIAMIEPQKASRFYAKDKSGLLFSSKKEALSYHKACIKELEDIAVPTIAARR